MTYVDINLYKTVANIVFKNLQFIISEHCVWRNASFILYNPLHLASLAFETKTFQLSALSEQHESTSAEKIFRLSEPSMSFRSGAMLIYWCPR